MPMPEMIFVDSSNIAAIGYDEEAKELYVEFLNGGLYVYRGVPLHVFIEFRSAPSQGSYLHRSIKNIYSYEKIA